MAAGLRQSLALFLGRGVAAWARACRSYASQPPTPTLTAPAALSSIPLDLRNQLALVFGGNDSQSPDTGGLLLLTADAHQKVTAAHLKRNAYLYIRQSTLRQVFENTESTKRQYALRHRAVALGWALDRIITIDSDLGQSGASAIDREGFQPLVAEIGVGKAGICTRPGSLLSRSQFDRLASAVGDLRIDWYADPGRRWHL